MYSCHHGVSEHHSNPKEKKRRWEVTKFSLKAALTLCVIVVHLLFCVL